MFDFALAQEDMDKIAALDMGNSLFLSHRDPETVKWLGNAKFNV